MTTPRVTETPPPLAAVTRDGFIDGLDHDVHRVTQAREGLQRASSRASEAAAMRLVSSRRARNRAIAAAA